MTISFKPWSWERSCGLFSTLSTVGRPRDHLGPFSCPCPQSLRFVNVGWSGPGSRVFSELTGDARWYCSSHYFKATLHLIPRCGKGGMWAECRSVILKTDMENIWRIHSRKKSIKQTVLLWPPSASHSQDWAWLIKIYLYSISLPDGWRKGEVCLSFT